MTKFKTIDDLDVKGKVVFVRADLNVPEKDGKVTDTTRIERFAPTVLDLIAKGAKVLVASHFSRPKGKVVPEMSLKIVHTDLENSLGKPVKFIDDCVGDKVAEAIKDMHEGDVVLLENLRFYAQEEANDPEFCKKLATNVDVYINDAFSAAHRAHASTEGMAKLLPNGAGRLMEAELKALDKALGNPERPVIAIVGGAKVSTKLDLLFNLVEKVDKLIIGGGMANTFLNAMGFDVGSSLCEKDMASTAIEILKKSLIKGCEIILPTDVVVAREFAEGADSHITHVAGVNEGEMILDVGPASIKTIAEKIAGSKTLIWNGPLGAFEIKPFDKATMVVSEIVADLTTEGKLLSVGGGGDTVSALKKAGVIEKMTYVSAAGGAFLEWMEGKVLPGVAALES